MNDLDTIHHARRLDVLGLATAEHSRRQRRSRWSCIQPLDEAPEVSVPDSVRPSVIDSATPGRAMVEELDVVRRELGLSVAEIWWRYFALGGSMLPSELDAALNHALVLTSTEWDLLAVALNECSRELGLGRRLLFCTELLDAS